MTPQAAALLLGIAYLGLGAFGFLPSLLMPPPEGAPEMAVRSLYGYFLGLFPVNVVRDLLHVAIGVWGLLAYAGRASARTYARAMAAVFLVLAVSGLVPGLHTWFGLMPAFGHDIWLSALSAALAGYVGYSMKNETTSSLERRQNGADRRRAMVPVARDRRENVGDRRSGLPASLAAG